MNRTRAADDFKAIRARLEELRRERDQSQLSEKDARQDPQPYRGRDVRWSATEISAGPGRVRQPGSGTPLDRDRAWWARRE